MVSVFTCPAGGTRHTPPPASLGGGAQPPLSRGATACLSLAEPSFVFADVMRERPDGLDSGDDRVYFFFTEVSVEYEFVFKLMIPRVARVCKVSPGPVPPPAPQPQGAPVSGGLATWPGSKLPLECRSAHHLPSVPHTGVDGPPHAQPALGKPGGSPCRPQECQQA